MFTTIAFSESIDPGAVFVNLAAVIDQHIKTNGDYVTVGNLNQLVAAYSCSGTAAAENRLVSPSLRRTNPFYIVPVEGAITPTADPLMLYRGDNPLQLETNETLESEINCDPGAAEQLATIVWLADGPLSPVNGAIHTINAEINAALVVDTWSFSEIEFPDALPVGQYAIVGARCVAAAAIAFRFVPVGAVNRPGGVCASLINAKDPFMQRYGRIGEWCQFDTTQPPGFEILGSAAVGAADYQIYLDIIPL